MIYYINEEQFTELRESYSGICAECGAVRYGNTEPDAEDYECEECESESVQGIENALLSDIVMITSNPDRVNVGY